MKPEEAEGGVLTAQLPSAAAFPEDEEDEKKKNEKRTIPLSQRSQLWLVSPAAPAIVRLHGCRAELNLCSSPEPRAILGKK